MPEREDGADADRTCEVDQQDRAARAPDIVALGDDDRRWPRSAGRVSRTARRPGRPAGDRRKAPSRHQGRAKSSLATARRSGPSSPSMRPPGAQRGAQGEQGAMARPPGRRDRETRPPASAARPRAAASVAPTATAMISGLRAGPADGAHAAAAAALLLEQDDGQALQAAGCRARCQDAGRARPRRRRRSAAARPCSRHCPMPRRMP